MRDAINKAARIVINHCLEHKIGRVVFGWNQGIKKEINIAKRNNHIKSGCIGMIGLSW
ncbi:transposase, IS605 OrfB [Microseira wollei NIES-4236]|uniref:Transposase, IS605 OrfB n=1 Tax=Microseira wollei NIES-4236 TaxID=2530354 RepID=A0AAV3XRM4_9CYAN|nr:transposase, IS605 OrfB [Microseira wollei NIES-4236]